jgi:hypothetical protein
MNEFKITNFNDNMVFDTCIHKKVKYSDTIYTFDIEVTSLFNIDGEYKPFNYDLPPTYYKNRDKVAIPYIWQVGINDKVYYSRDFYKFNDFLVCISTKYIRKIIYVHNLSYEFQFLRNIIDKYNYTIVDFLTYKKRKIISFVIEELNIEFRCSYCLTNLSLSLSAKKYNKKYKKLDGDLDYTLARSPKTPLNDTELSYCEFDILALYEIIVYFKNIYKHVAKIPLTQTGIVRKELINSCPWYFKEKITRMLPTDNMYTIFKQLFTGGFVHSNYKQTNKVIKNVYSMDLTSAYPYCICAFKYPMTKFFEVKNVDRFKYYYNHKWCRIMLVEFDCKSKDGHSLISVNKLLEYDDIKKDNGRVLEGKNIKMLINEIDLENINLIYNVKEFKVFRMWVSRADVLPYFLIDKILKFYENKTKLKGVEGQEEFYMQSKQKLNSIYGCFCTDLIRESISYSDNDYKNNGFNNIADLKERIYNNIFYYPWGAWCTSYCRRLLCSMINKVGKNAIYNDTDSIKFKGKKYLKLFDSENEKIKEQLNNNLSKYKIAKERFSPKDIKGKKHTLGVWELDGVYNKFKTLGAKRYCYVTDDNKIKMVVSGLSNKCKIDDINDFTIGKKFSYSDAQKNLSNYNDSQKCFGFKDKTNSWYYCDNIKYSINMQPTTFVIGITDDYARLLDFINYLLNQK